MEWGALALVVLLVVALTVGVARRKKPSSSSATYPYCRNEALFTPAERSFLGVLDQMVGEQYRVMGKVRIADIISVRPMQDKGQWQAAFNRISAKHFDFLLCDKDDLSPIAAIELDDKSHSAEKRRQRDEFVSGVCEAASLRLLRIPARQAYTRSDIERLVVNPLNPREDVVSAEVPSPSTPAESDVPTTRKASPNCPKCASSMVLGTVKSGARAGERLWGCLHYPECRGILPITAVVP